MAAYTVGFLDFGFLRAQGARALGVEPRQVKPSAAKIVEWFKSNRPPPIVGRERHQLLRVYWYDGAFDPSDSSYKAQRRFLNAIASTPGVQLRLGRAVRRTPNWHYAIRRAIQACGLTIEEFETHYLFRQEVQQKGVDTLMVLDLVRFAERDVYDLAVVVSGDRDLAAAVEVAQDAGKQVWVGYPLGGGVASELRHLADQLIEIPTDALGGILEIQPGEGTPPVTTDEAPVPRSERTGPGLVASPVSEPPKQA
jgi:uncharacterized LabA/DUF88 family protein